MPDTTIHPLFQTVLDEFQRPFQSTPDAVPTYLRSPGTAAERVESILAEEAVQREMRERRANELIASEGPRAERLEAFRAGWLRGALTDAEFRDHAQADDLDFLAGFSASRRARKDALLDYGVALREREASRDAD